MECCVGVSIETVLQLVEFYTVVNWKKLKKKTHVSDYSPPTKDNSPKRQFFKKKFFQFTTV